MFPFLTEILATPLFFQIFKQRYKPTNWGASLLKEHGPPVPLNKTRAVAIGGRPTIATALSLVRNVLFKPGA